MTSEGIKGRIDPRSVPQGRIAWASAFRLKPHRIPEDKPLSLLGEDADGLDVLRVLTAPSERHIKKQVPVAPEIAEDLDDTLLAAFACSIPEWRFAARGQQHVVVSSNMAAAISLAAEVYGQFLKDTGQSAMQMNFVVERYHLNGTFADISDRELFPACYQADNWPVSQALVTELGQAGLDGMVYGEDKGQSAVVLQANALKFQDTERAISLEWTGARFTRAYDYRILEWQQIA